MNISATFIKRPVATTLLTAGLVLSGVIAFRLLPVSPLPQVDFPTISVQAALPGADPETMATSVAAPLERQFGRIAGVAEMTSTSYRGSTSITLQFDLNRDIDGAARDVQAAINAARGFLPANLPANPTYRKVNPSDAPILILALTSDTKTTAQMYDAASSILQQKLSQVEGVGQVFVGGSSLPAVRIDLNPLALSKYGISLESVRSVLASTNVNRPKGQLAFGDKTWEIRTNDQLSKAEQYLPLVIAYRSGAAVRLGDVADVQDSVEDLRAAGFVNGKPAVMVIVFRQPGANIIETVDNVRELLPQLEAALPGAVTLSLVLDRSPSIRGSLRDVEWTLHGLGRARDPRGVLVPAERARHDHPRGRGRRLDHRHLRRDVPLRLLARQPLAHGAHDLNGVRGGRRDRRPRERHPLPGKRGIAPPGRAVRDQGDRLHGPVHEHFARCRVHPDPPDGRHGGQALSGICRNAFGSDHGLAPRIAHHDADDVRHDPEAGETRRSRHPVPGKRTDRSTGCTVTTKRAFAGPSATPGSCLSSS